MGGHKFRRTSSGKWIDMCVWTTGLFVYLFLTLPVCVIVLSAFSPTAYPKFPPTEFSIRWFEGIFNSPEWMESIWISGVLLVIVTPLTVILGTAASYALARLQFPGKNAVQSFILSPLMIPQIVLGVALLYLFTMMGINGTITGLVIGHMLISLPYVVRTVGVSVANLDPKLELASMNLGAGPVHTFFKVTLPLIKPGMIAGAVFSAVTSFGEISISLFVSSPMVTPIPVRTFSYIEQTFDPSVNAISVIFIAVSVIALVIIERTIGLSKTM
ncbi:ABC transporter permease [Bacillus sonorensis]|uniref:Spermidine/putrescine ABC transporter permease n=2 Tax=Bacillus sonorensis TaxID=119858 RepID=M5P092_9BACI|nr:MULTISPECIES: ABC transporter permease [Bacillus]TWK73812.1 Inner membrane ABC transporter permease protein YdcV [Bacillus paralicheniformis]ASB91122.1 Trehalose/maltose transport system permease protein MalG [Bacillus sonorensis]EME72833.1 spermidine/putrescine ABC transporter permease [Bacillus sonorensis L12]MCZ0074057.1 ABC transporter permease [Bacillus sonorensis]MCZ0092679.1 ABC transporter permease [Bacillus sonorensis]